MDEYTHRGIGEEVHCIAGHYEIIEEGRLAYGAAELLYVLGVATVDNACCGSTGCRFLLIPGYVHSWKTKTNAEGMPVSIVAPITEEQQRASIRAFLDKRYPYAQINFSGA
ncbi:MAG: hypothetical protein EG826_11145 [Deltaproteobacteria bacterium]|nr:hypothetical protein [Deltaproteobacteria bacterium]